MRENRIFKRLVIFAIAVFMSLSTVTTVIAATGDDCSDPIVVNIPGDLDYSDIGQTTCGRVDDYDATALGSYDGGEDIIYELVVSSATDFIVTVTSPDSWIGIGIFDDCPDVGNLIASDTGFSGPWTLTVSLSVGTYYLMVDSWPSPDCVDFDLTIELPGPGSNCTLAVPVTPGSYNCPGAEYWYEYTASCDGAATVTSDVPGASVDTYLYIYDECGGSIIDSNDDKPGYVHYVFASEVTFPISTGEDYYIFWDDTYSSLPFDWQLTEVCGCDLAVTSVLHPTNGDGPGIINPEVYVSELIGSGTTCDVYMEIYQGPLGKECLPLENFEGAFPPAGWSIVNNGGDCVWMRNDMYGRTNYCNGVYSADADSDACGSGTTMDTELITPTFSLADTATPILEYECAYNYLGSTGEFAAVDISIDGGSSWTNLETYTSDVGAYGSVLITIPLTAYAGETNCKIRFHYNAPGWDWWWQVDDVHVYQPGATTPVHTCSNLGFTAPGNAILTPSWTPAVSDLYSVKAWVEATCDNNPSNDEIQVEMLMIGDIDAGVDMLVPTSLMGPVSFKPEGNVTNYGDLDLPNCPVHCWIDTTPTLVFTEDFESLSDVNTIDVKGETICDENPKKAEGPVRIQWEEDPELSAVNDWSVYNYGDPDGYWHWTTDRYVSPTHSMRCADPLTGDAPVESGDWLISPSIMVEDEAGYIEVEVWKQYYEYFGGYHRVFIGNSPDGSSFYGQWHYYEPDETWTTIVQDLYPDYIASDGTTYVGFMFRSSYSGYEGAYVDDVKVYSGGNNVYDETITVSVDAGTFTDAVFPPFTPMTDKDYTAYMCTEQPYDENPTNDCDGPLDFNTGAPVYILENGYGYATIQEGIDAAEDGQTVVATDGTYYEDIIVDKPITVSGENIDSIPDATSCTYHHNHGSFIKGTVELRGPAGGGSGIVLQNFDINPPVTFTDHEAAVMIYGNDVTVRQNTIHNVRGKVDDSSFTIKGIHVYGGPSSPGSNILIENNTIRDILNENVTGGSMNYIINEDFEGTCPPSGWNIYDIDGTGYTWECATSHYSGLDDGGATGTFMYMDEYLGGDADLYDNWMDILEVEIDCTDWQDVTLDFDGDFEAFAGYGDLWVEVYDGSTWHTVLYQDDDLDPGGSGTGFDQDPRLPLDISTHVDGVSNAKIRWRYSDENYSSFYAYGALIDNVVVEGVNTAGGGGIPYGGATGVMIQGYLDGVSVMNNRIEDIHSAGWCYGVEVTPTASGTLSGSGSFATIYESDFESDDGGWVASADWDTVGDWEWTDDYDVSCYTGDDTPPPAAYSGDGFWGTVVCGDYTNAGGTSYLSQTFDFSSVSGATLNFWQWMDVFGSFDYCEIFVNGVQEFYQDTYDPTDWEEVTVDLSAYDGMSSVEIEFALYATTVVNYAGWYIDDVTILGEGGGPGPGPGENTPQNVVINCNYFTAIGDSSVYDVWNKPMEAPYPGIMVTIDTYGQIPADPTEVTLKCNYFDPDCYNTIYAVINKNLDLPLDATHNYWGRADGPADDPYNPGVQDPSTGYMANGLGCSIVNYGQVMFDPWLGIHANIYKPMGDIITVEVGEIVRFDAEGSFAFCFATCEECCEPSEQDLQYLWDFGDDRFSTNKAISHVYEQPGTYQVSLMVDTFGFPYHPNFMYDWDYMTVEVVEAGQPLSGNADGENLGGYEGIVEQPITFYGAASGGEKPYIYKWDFGDGSDEKTTEGRTIQHTYLKSGTYTLTLTVIDWMGDTITDTTTVTVYDIDELIVSFKGQSNVAQGDSISFTSTVSGGKSPYTYNWDFGDGVISSKANPTHIYETAGTYTVTLTVTDSNNDQKTKTKTITVTPTDSDTVEIMDVKGGFGIKATIQAGDTDCDWEITIDGNMVLFGGEKTGTITANGEETVRSGLTIALGNVDVTVTADTEVKEYTAFALGPLFLNVQSVEQ